MGVKKEMGFALILFPMRLILLLFSAQFFLFAASSQGKSFSRDTLAHAIAIDTITKLVSQSEFVINPSANIISIDLGIINSTRLEDAFHTLPSLFVKSYGGRSGISTLSIRGGNPSSSLVLLNGMRLSSSQSGIFDISKISSSVIASIDLVESGSGVLNGSNAMSGVINLNTKTYGANSFGVGAGSFDDYSVSTNLQVVPEVINLSASYELFSGRYPFRKFDEMHVRQNADFERLNFILDYQLYSNLTFTHWFNHNGRGIPGPTVYQNLENDTLRSNEFDNMTIIKFNNETAIGNLDLGFSYRNTSSAIDGGGSDVEQTLAKFSNNGIQMKGQLAGESPLGSFTGVVESGFDILYGDNLDPGVGRKVERFRNSFGFLQSINFSNKGVWGIDIGTRLEHYSDSELYSNNSISVRFGYKNMKLSTGVSNNTRVPAFNELYYLNFGNSDLVTEKNISIPFDVVLSDTIGLPFKLSASAYYNSYDDMIVAIPLTPLIVSAQNFEKTRIVGVTTNVKIDWWGLVTDIGYMRQIPEEITAKGNFILPNTPQEKFNLNLAYRIDDFGFSTSTEYLSFRYIGKGEDSDRVLSSYATTDFSLSYLTDFWYDSLILSIRVDNVFNEQYEVLDNFPMPGRLFGLNIKYRN